MQRDKRMYDRAYKWLVHKRKKVQLAMERAERKPGSDGEMRDLRNTEDVLAFLLGLVTEENT